jgi:16S rRNA (guanine(527)-N(7))-methyltransferase RsmG
LAFKELLAAEFSAFGALSDEQLAALEHHYALLVQWNQRMNLTRIEKLEDAVRLHYCESLFLGLALPAGPLRIADVGSGAGFPGLPVAVWRPECTVDLIESHQRKAVFLREVSSGRKNIGVSSVRAETIAKRFDWTISRAVTPSDVLGFNLSLNSAILMAESDVPGLNRKPLSVQRVPWGTSRVLALFHVEQFGIEEDGSAVSRGT